MEDLIQQADSIVLGEVVDGESRYPEDGKTIYTYLTFKVAEDLKGDTAGENVVVKYPVGEIDLLGQVVCTTPLFDVRDLEGGVLLFLRKVPEKNKESQCWIVVGSFQGKFYVRKDKVTGKRIIVSKGKIDRKRWDVSEEIPFAVFKEEIKRIIEKRRIQGKLKEWWEGKYGEQTKKWDERQEEQE